jgi:hypothetical protein
MMSNIGIIDVVEWQTVVDMRRGIPVDADGHLVEITRNVLKKQPYPGDLESESVSWVSNVALDLYESYQPRFMLLSYAQPYFISVFQDQSQINRKVLVEQIFKDIGRFTEKTGMVPLILGTGELTDLAGYINLSNLDCLALGGGMVGRYAGLYEPTQQDLDYVHNHSFIKGVFSKDEIINLFGEEEDFNKRLPDYMLMAKEGYIFKTLGSIPRRFYQVPAENKTIPLRSLLGSVDSITDIRRFIENGLTTQNIALVIIEGIGFDEFPKPYTICTNHIDWYQYSPGDGQYLTINTGRHLPYHSYSPGYKYYIEDTEDREYPFSAFFAKNGLDTLGSKFSGRSAAVGTRSILTHLASGADIAIECFARGLYNYGTIGVINKGLAL